MRIQSNFPINPYSPASPTSPSAPVASKDEKVFINLLDNMTQTQNNAQSAIYNLLTKGEGEPQEVLIQQMKAESQMKTAAVIRDNVIENYKQLLNMQI
ncbi:flagellar hook-basal body complex protein FliE [Microbacteriaceae bacterium 4G12]